MPARELILDGEAIALQPGGKPHPFQTTMRRFGRRLDVEALRHELPLTPFFFDVIRRDETDLLDATLRERTEALADLAPSSLVPRRVVTTVADAEAFYDEALASGHEGVMAKSPESSYAAGSRGVGWYKVKPAHTLDLVVLAVEQGSGRRSAWLSNLHLGARDGLGGFAMIGKTFKGMTDAMLQWQTRRFRELAVTTDGYVTHLRPEQVVEIAFNDVQESSHYASGWLCDSRASSAIATTSRPNRRTRSSPCTRSCAGRLERRGPARHEARCRCRLWSGRFTLSAR
jgi:DNA ligase-1